MTVIDQIVGKDVQYRAALKARANLAKERGSLMAKLKDKALEPDARSAIWAECSKLNGQIQAAEARSDELFGELEKLLCLVGVMIQPDVPVSNDERDNLTVMTCGRIPTIPNFRAHHELLAMIDGFDAHRGARVAGHRGYYLKGVALKLNQALFCYGLDFLQARGFLAVHTPFFMRRTVMQRVCQLEDFEECLYHVDSATLDKNDDMFLIATSEQTLCGFHLNEAIDKKDLAIRYAGFSTCFRKEAGAAGKDNWGIFRVHQFEKVEQFCITSPHGDDSDRMHHEMIDNSCDFLRSLGLLFRVVLVVSSELNYSTSKKYDVEGWFPSYGTYRELVSGSNCLDFQARKLDIRFGHGKNAQGGKEFVHMLNCTLCATERTLCAILENYQTPDGIRIPKVLQPYMRAIAAPAARRTDFNEPDVDLQAAAEAVEVAKEDVTFILFVKAPPSAKELAAAAEPA
jgi:seryl-tRNA synthetase